MNSFKVWTTIGMVGFAWFLHFFGENRLKPATDASPTSQARTNAPRGDVPAIGAETLPAPGAFTVACCSEPQVVSIEVRAYCPCSQCCARATGKTSRGNSAWLKGLAGYPCFPYGTEILVPGYGRARVDDTGGMVRQRHAAGKYYIEIRFQTHDEARRWGVKRFRLELVAPYELTE